MHPGSASPDMVGPRESGQFHRVLMLMWKSEDSFGELVIFFHRVDSWDGIQVVKDPYPFFFETRSHSTA